MAAVAFDTLKFAERLERGGFSVQQARAAAEASAEATGEELATKRDVAAVSADVKALSGEVKALSAEFKREIQRVEERFDAKIGHLDTKIGHLDAKIDHLEARFDAKLELVKRDITIRLGGMMIVGFGALLAALRFMLPAH